MKSLDISKIVENCGLEATPVLHNGVLYISEYSSYFRAISADNGCEIWSYKTNGALMSSPALSDNVLYFGSLDNYVYALSTGGNLLWKVKTGDRIASGPAVSGDAVYIGSSDNNLYAFDKKTGKELWRFRTGAEIVGDVLVHAGRIYFGSMDTYFYCLDFRGNIIWKFKTGDSIVQGPPVADDERVYFSSADEKIYAFSLDGEFIWGFKTGDGVVNRGTLNGNVLYWGSRDGRLYALNKETGVCFWRFNNASGAPIGSTPVIVDGAIYFGGDKFYSLDLNGFLLWSFHTTDVIVSKPIVYKKTLIFGGMDGHIRALSLDGRLVWSALARSSYVADFFGVIPPLKNNPSFLEDRAKHLGLSRDDLEKKLADFKPYTFKANSDIKSYISSDVERYGGISESIGAYKDAGMGAAGAYSPGGKKKSVNDEILERQINDQFGI